MKTIPIRQLAGKPKETTATGKFNIREVASLLGGKDLMHDLHKHNFFFVLVLEKGEGFHEIDFTRYELHDHAVFILRPGQVHQLLMKANCTGYLLEFDYHFYQPANSLSEQRWKKASNKNHCEVAEKRFKKLLSNLANIFLEYQDKQEGYIEAIKARLDLFFIELLRQSSDPTSVTRHAGSYNQDQYETFISLVETKIAEVKSVSKYASLLNLSVYQLNAITLTTVGKKAAELINEQVILDAKRYLLATPNQVKDIAWHLGFEDVSYFIRFFKRHTGHSPEAFRQNFK